ncbi:MAG TPA: VCBS domain-containing protein [Rhizomicrobium sp.]|nr:VCBS domain-containing protein [Rhizomicrobium sp.]
MVNLTNGNDTYNGTEGDDIVNGRGGDDIINGLGGDDQINGGSGNDTIDGGEGDDQISGGSDDDTLIGGAGNDILIGGSGEDTAVIHANGANGIGSSNGATLTVLTADGQDQLTGIEHIQFDNGTVDIINGNAEAFLGADGNSINQSGAASGNALSNDFDIDDTMTLTGIHSDNMNTTGSLGASLSGQYGSLTLNADGTYSYTAGAGTDSLGVGESVTDVFTYTVHSGSSDFTQTISIVINGTNDTPDITSSATSASYTDTLLNDTFSNFSGSLTAHDTDTSDTLTFGATGATANAGQPGYDMAVAGSYGTLYINSATGAYVYIPNDTAMEALKTSASDSFTFTVSDGHGGTDSQSFTVSISGTNDKPTLGAISGMTFTDTSADDTFATQTGSLSGGDRDNDTLTYHATGETLDNSQGAGFDHSVAGTYGTLYFNASTGAYEYVPNDGAIEGLKTTASETFSFSASDGALSSTAQTLTITLNGVNDTPVISASSPTTELTESGGVSNGNSGTLTSSSTMTLSDRDSGDTPSFDTTALANNGWVNDGGGFWHKIGTYGTATLDTATGHVTYGLNDNDTDTQALQTGDTVHDIFTLYATDGTAGSSTTVDFTIHGANDAAVIAGSLSGSATEAGGVANGTPGGAASGTATDTDVDNAANTFQVVTGGSTTNHYGSFSIDASGNWVYTVDDSNGSVQALNVGQSLSDTFTIHSADGTSQTISVTIFGANDAAVVSGTTGGNVVESGGTLFSGTPTASGHITDTDVDNTPNLFQAVGTLTATDHSYGGYTIDASGNWSFTLNNNNATIQALNDGDHITETFTVHTVDGTAQVISIVIDGHNELFNGTGGNDVLRGTAYGDTFTGGDGNDTYVVNNAADKIVESVDQGEDTVQTSVSYTLGANVEDMTLSGHGDIDGTGNELNNLLVGNSGANHLNGMAGDDMIRGGSGADTIDGGAGDDNLDGGVGQDTASYASATAGVTVSLANTGFQNTVGAGWDKLTGFENLTGSGFADTLTGDSSKNTITGGGGADTITGGGGIDTFVYTAASDSAFGAADRITDLTNNEKIDLSAIANDFTIVSTLDGHAHEITLSYNSGTNTTTISIDMNGDGVINGSDMQILVNGDHHTFTGFIGLSP